MATNKAKAQQQQTERTSEVQINLRYAQTVADTIAQRRIRFLEQQIANLEATPLSHPVDISLRVEMCRKHRAEIKQLRESLSVEPSSQL